MARKSSLGKTSEKTVSTKKETRKKPFKKAFTEKKEESKESKDPYDEAIEILKRYHEGNPPEKLEDDY